MADIASANFCYQHEQYLACCIVLLTLIERVLVKSEINENRKTGIGAIRLFSEKVYKANKNYYSIHLVMVKNTLEYLNLLFKRADDFKVQPDYLNRNFILHGMFEKDITKNDCIKLFLGLFNVIKFYDRFIVQNRS